jgi:hypothetical protein
MEKYYTWFREINGWDALTNNDIKVGFWAILAGMLLIFIILFYGLFSLIDSMTGTKKYFYGTIIDKSHSESTLSTNMAVGVNTSGGLSAVPVSSGNPESWSLIIREEHTDKVIKLKTTMQVVYDSKIGQRIEFSRKYGGITKKELSTELS